MIPTENRERVIITNVRPQIDGGQFPAKAIAGQPLLIAADIFCDGHDSLNAAVLIKHRKERQWREYALNFINNDHWELHFVPQAEGHYQFRIKGWIDHFASWQKATIKKLEASQDVRVDLQSGVLLLQDCMYSGNAKDKKYLAQQARLLESYTDAGDIITLLQDKELSNAMTRCRKMEEDCFYPLDLGFEAERTRAGFSTWYELFPRSASLEPGRHGNFKDVQKILPRIALMGFDVLYLPPIHPIGEQKRKGRNNALTANEGDPGSPWAVGSRLGGHKAIHPQLGTMADFKELVQAAKEYGMELAMDIAFQCAPDHPYVTEHPQWFKWRPDGTVQYAENPPKKYEDILPFHFETEDWENLWQELKSVFDFWIAAGVTIFRIDNPHTKPLKFWQWVISEIRRRQPQVIFLAEAFTRPRIMEQLAKAGFNQSYTYFTWRNTKQELEQYMKELTATDMRYYFRPNFWPNTPDILPEHLAAGGENAHILRLVLAATLSSNYGLYGPVYEFGVNTQYPGKEEYIDNEKYEIKNWDWNRQTRIAAVMTRINRIRRENAALQSTCNIAFSNTDNDQLMCYYKKDTATGNTLIIIVNLDVHNTQSGYVLVPWDKLGLQYDTGYTVDDLLSGDRYHWQEAWNYVQLNPNKMPAHILSVNRKI